MKLQAKLIICLLLLVIGGILGWTIRKPEYVTNTIIQIDTVFVKSPPEVKWKTAYINVVKNDTTIITNVDTIYVAKNLKIASDTTYFDKDTLHVWYFYSPVNRFKYEMFKAPRPIVYETKTITIIVKPKWYQNPYLWGSVGLVTGVILGR